MKMVFRPTAIWRSCGTRQCPSDTEAVVTERGRGDHSISGCTPCWNERGKFDCRPSSEKWYD